MARELKIKITGDDGVEQTGLIQEESLPAYEDNGWSVVEEGDEVAATAGNDATAVSPTTAPALPAKTTRTVAPAPDSNTV